MGGIGGGDGEARVFNFARLALENRTYFHIALTGTSSGMLEAGDLVRRVFQSGISAL